MDRWSLHLEEPFADGTSSFCAPATRGDGSSVVLKIAFPHRESTYEPDALRLWDGGGAVRLLEWSSDEVDGGAMLLERCRPGTPLHEAGAEAALDVFVDLLPRLWKPVRAGAGSGAGAAFGTLADEAAWWAGYVVERWERAGKPFPVRVLDAVVAALDELPGTQGEQVLVNQDLHAGNVLRAERQPWLLIDPKPLAGERAFSVAPIVRGGELGHSRRAAVHRLDTLCQRLGLDRDRARRWTIAQTVAWSSDGGRTLPGHIEVAGWMIDAA